MAVAAGRHRLGPDRGRLLLRTSRHGLAAQAGHDLTIEVARWSGELTVGGDRRPAELAVVIDLGSLVVVAGTGGIKPLTERDRREIVTTAAKVLQADRYPQARFVATAFEPDPSQTWATLWRGAVTGTLTIRHRSRPLRLEVAGTGDVDGAGDVAGAGDVDGAGEAGGRRYRATATVVQSDYGIKPYTAFLGALRVRDAVDVDVELDLSEPQTPLPKQP
ncbi:MAG: YceI family protein [Actinomycetes bacterium]